MRPKDRQRIQDDVATRVTKRYARLAAERGPHFLEGLVHDTLYHERVRLEGERRRAPRTKADRAFYADLRARLAAAGEGEHGALVEALVRHFAAEIVGSFKERVYRFSTTAVPKGLALLLNTMSPKRLFSPDTYRDGLSGRLIVQGEVEHARDLTSRGTVIVVPTHSSNLDSIVIGYAAYLAGLPPLTYGAGINLFTNPLVSFFMRNLGAYRVDRRKKADLYKEALKEYATCSLEMGYHNLFFPGGTRSRSGKVERELKKGLLGTAVQAFVANLRQGRPRPNLYILPCTLSYKLVLEAETLIDDHLKEVGKSRYIITDDEFSKARRVLGFAQKLSSMDGRIVVTFSPPIDILGNPVDRGGQSLDPRGRLVDARRYVMRAGEPVHDEQRDHEYTSELAQRIGEAFAADNCVMSTNVVAWVLFRMLRRDNPELDLYRLLRTGGRASAFPLQRVQAETEALLAKLRARGRGPRLGDDLQGRDARAVVDDALRHFSVYHRRPAAVRRNGEIVHEDRNLLLFYGNRLDGYGLERA